MAHTPNIGVAPANTGKEDAVLPQSPKPGEGMMIGSDSAADCHDSITEFLKHLGASKIASKAEKVEIVRGNKAAVKKEELDRARALVEKTDGVMKNQQQQ